MFLIDDRRTPEPAPVEPNWPVLGWVLAAIVLLFAAGAAGGLVGFLLVCAAVYAGCRGVDRAVGYWGGLSEWRQ